jgi:hypothetical protein
MNLILKKDKYHQVLINKCMKFTIKVFKILLFLILDFKLALVVWIILKILKKYLRVTILK